MLAQKTALGRFKTDFTGNNYTVLLTDFHILGVYIEEGLTWSVDLAKTFLRVPKMNIIAQKLLISVHHRSIENFPVNAWFTLVAEAPLNGASMTFGREPHPLGSHQMAQLNEFYF